MKLSNLILYITVLLSSSLIASDADVRYNYFGNLTGSVLNEKGYEVNSLTNSNIDNTINFSTYSKIGAQVSVFKDDFSFMAQGLAYQSKGENKFDITWLNGKYQLNDNFSIRAGRMQFAFFLNSDTLDVDYVHLWAKAPIEIYSIMPLRSFDGLELTYEKIINDYYIYLKLTPTGTATREVNVQTNTVDVDFKKMKAISLSIQKDNFTFNSSYTVGNYTMPDDSITGLIAIRGALGALGNDVSSYSYDNKKVELLSLGVDYNYENYSFSSEFTHTDSHSLAPNLIAYYLMMSYRYDKFTPFIMYSENKNDKDFYNVDNINIPTNLSAEDYANAMYAKAGLESIIYSMNSSQQTNSIGFRYDYKVGIAFKVQFDRITFSDYGVNPAAGLTKYQRYGFLSQETKVENKPVYQFTVGLSFAY